MNGCATAVLAFALAMALTSCDSARPSESDLANAIYDEGNSAGQGDLWLGWTNRNIHRKGARCIAKTLYKSKVPDEALRAIIDRDEKYKKDKAFWDGMVPVMSELGACMEVTPQDPDIFLK